MLLIFDLDGTLFRTADGVVRAVNRLRAEMGLVSLPEPKILENIGKKTPLFLNAVLKDLPEEQIRNSRERYRELEHEEINRGGLFSGIYEMLERLSHKNQLCICSNGSLDYLHRVLSKTKVEHFFSAIQTASIFCSKAEAVKELLNKGEDAVVIGDTLEDWEAAEKNELPFVWAAYGYGKGLEQAPFRAENVMEMEAHLSRLRVFYELYHYFKGKRIIGISGVDASGKTEFTDAYSRFLAEIGVENQIVHIDDFHNPVRVRQQGSNPVEAYYRNAFDYDRLIQEILRPLSHGEAFVKTLFCLDLGTDQYNKKVDFCFKKDTVALLEGVLLFRQPLLNFLDGTVFLDIPFDEMLRRAEKRDTVVWGADVRKRYLEKYIPIQKKYLKECYPKENCDVLIDNRNYNAPVIMRTKKRP